MELLSRRRFLKLSLGSAVSLTAFPLCCRPAQAEPARPATLDEKIGAMLIGGFRGIKSSPSLPVIRDLKQQHLGGVVLYDYDVPTHRALRNIQSPAQVKALISGLQAVSAVPLLITIDEEGGKISRLKEKYGFPPTVSAQRLGEKDDPAYTYRQAHRIAETLAGLGFNLNFAPVVDLNTNPGNPVIGKLERSFSANPDIVTRQALAFIKAHHAAGVGCTLKHFPGHGSSTGDSHTGFVDVTETWSPIELEPYKTIIHQGMADAVMTAHIYNAKLDSRYPATLSKPVITGILREKMGYQGVIISDDMQMGAIRKYYGFEKALRLAIEAGIDIILIANNSIYDGQALARAAAVIKRLVKQGKISTKRIDASYRRIRRLKQKYAGVQTKT
jgi:beta-N-acetylhexosaminidase